MSRKFLVPNFALITLIVVSFILYGSLYPFAFHSAPPGAWDALVGSWKERPGRGDLLANILLYVPLGYFGSLSLGRGIGTTMRALLVALFGACLSIGVELTQYYDAGRNTAASDVYTNIAGTVIGIAAALSAGSGGWRRLPLPRRADPAILLLLGAWTGYNLFPFAPVIDLHKYWHAVQPLLHPSLSLYSAFTHVAVWVAVAALVAELAPERRGVAWYAVFAAFLLGAKILIMDLTLSAAELAGAAGGLVWLMVLAGQPRWRMLSAAALLGCSIIALRLEPFNFSGPAQGFGWIPFHSFMFGSLQVDALAFLEKGFLYGSLIWLLQKNRVRPPVAVAAVAALLLVTSVMEIYLPSRSAEITDCVMALFIGGVIALVRLPGGRGMPG